MEAIYQLILNNLTSFSDLTTAVIAGNDPFKLKTSPQNRKTFITQSKHDILIK